MPPGRYRMPAEWEPHEGTWLAWPHEITDWPGKFAPVRWVYTEIVRKLARHERVHILVNDLDTQQRATRMLRKADADLEAVDFVHCRSDRSWTRDFCPIFVLDDAGRPVVMNWRFNGWAKYSNWQVDDAVGSTIAAGLNYPEVQPVCGDRRIVLEGGSIDVNGCGSLLTTEECLLSDVQSRNPGMTRAELEHAFAEYLGIRKTLWLRNGIAGDDTHGHVDDLARFTGPRTVVIGSESDPADPNYEPLKENLALLREMTDQDGDPLEVIPLPMPEPLYFARQRLPASYANFYVGNRSVLVPTFNDSRDRQALDILAGAFPGREITGVHAVDLVLGLGTLHCLTQQQIQAPSEPPVGQ